MHTSGASLLSATKCTIRYERNEQYKALTQMVFTYLRSVSVSTISLVSLLIAYRNKSDLKLKEIMSGHTRVLQLHLRKLMKCMAHRNLFNSAHFNESVSAGPVNHLET